MVTNPGTSARVDSVRALNTPRKITIVAENGVPAVLITPKTEERVMQIQDVWVVQDEWWRHEIDRQYFALLMQNGELRTIFHDRIDDMWYEQAY